MYELPQLPYAKDALEPYMSAETFDYHHGKHHQVYVTKANNLIEGSGFEGKPIEEVIKGSYQSNQGLFNNVAQHWNHAEYWKAMKPNGGGAIPGELEKKIAEDFGSVDAFKETFVNDGVGQFGSGWVWLAMTSGGKLETMGTPNAENPLVHDAHPILICDVWEHAYYVDYRNKRPDFIKAFIDNMVNWEYAAERFAAAS